MTSKPRPRPKFKRVLPPHVVPGTPTELFGKLQREPRHGYLRAGQQDILREYERKAIDAPNVALELPTGTGKTAVGLLIAEWRRRKYGGRVAYLTLTNQLASQVLQEAAHLGIPAASLIGDRDARNATEEGRFRAGQAIGVTSYANLFNTNPVIQEATCLVLDDAHGGEQKAVDQWTLRIVRKSHSALYDSVLGAIAPALTDTQRQAVALREGVPVVELADVSGHPECLVTLAEIMKGVKGDHGFKWSQIRMHLHACVVLFSPSAIVIRPVTPPTHTHDPFTTASQRLFLSATLGSEGDLLRAYGLDSLSTVRVDRASSGRRYVFVPEMYADRETALEVLRATWEQLEPRRAVLLAPSAMIADATAAELSAALDPKPKVLGVEDIAESLAPFAKADDALLALAARYDGLDLPDDDCRLLVMSESPRALGELERHWSTKWALGPLLRQRERTRLIQGMGRCTRSATDYSVIVWLGQSLVDAATSPQLVDAMPSEARAELAWGLQQSELAHSDPTSLSEMIVSLLQDKEARQEANELLDQVAGGLASPVPVAADATAREEVLFARALWDGNWTHAYTLARQIADMVGGPSMSGWRAWWWLQAASAARGCVDRDGEIDCLERAKAAEINSGWLDDLLRQRLGEPGAGPMAVSAAPNAAAIWNALDSLGWAGKRFESALEEMIRGLDSDEASAFHVAWETLGTVLGFAAIRPKGQGVPDGVWPCSSEAYLILEAKTEKTSAYLSKREVQEATGHSNWVRDTLCDGQAPAECWVVIVSPASKVDGAGAPHVGDLRILGPAMVSQFGREVSTTLRELRVKFVRRDFAEVCNEFTAAVAASGLDEESIIRCLTAQRLADVGS